MPSEDEATRATALLEACPALSQRAYATTRRDYRDRFDVGGGPLPLFPPTVVDMDLQTRKRPALPLLLPLILADTHTLPPSCNTPFLCTSAGCLPRGVPDDVDDLVSGYLVSGVSRASPNLDVDGQSVECTSNGQARRALAKASEQKKPYWVACHVPIEHPPWWPAGGTAEAVPGFEHLIAGEGTSGIGMHRDRYRLAGQPDRLVSTYLALGRGRKHVILLPPTAEGARLAEKLGGEGCDSADGRPSSQRTPMPVRPQPEVCDPAIEPAPR